MKFNYKFENKKGMMPYKFDNGKIYKIVSDNTNDIYIGSTTNTLKQRLQEHESKYRKKKLGLKACDILKFGSYRMELIENYPCNNRKELFKREGEIQKEYKKFSSKFMEVVKTGKTLMLKDSNIAPKNRSVNWTERSVS